MLEELIVKDVVIGKQFEDCENYQKFIKIVKEKKIKVHVAEAGQKIHIENDLYFDVLWPDSKNIINQNILNNNSLVCKLVYRNFSMLLTGDIEEVAEKTILSKYAKNPSVLNSNVLKVAHHGSKTSSTKEFLEAVRPKYVLIGVGAKNNFGHPSATTLDNLEMKKCEIYRTDENGEIAIMTNGKNIKIKKHIK